MLEMSHGYEAVDNDDPIIREANVLVANFASASNPGGHLVDWLPFCECSAQRTRGKAS